MFCRVRRAPSSLSRFTQLLTGCDPSLWTVASLQLYTYHHHDFPDPVFIKRAVRSFAHFLHVLKLKRRNLVVNAASSSLPGKSYCLTSYLRGESLAACARMTASVQLAFNTAAAYDYLVTNHGNPIALLRPPWYV